MFEVTGDDIKEFDMLPLTVPVLSRVFGRGLVVWVVGFVCSCNKLIDFGAFCTGLK